MQLDIKIVPDGSILQNLLIQLKTGFQLKLIDKQATPIISLDRGQDKDKNTYFLNVSFLLLSGRICSAKTPIYITKDHSHTNYSRINSHYEHLIDSRSSVIQRIFDVFKINGVKGIVISSEKQLKEAPDFRTITL